MANFCIRCKAALPEESNFCASCGFTNHAEIATRSMNANQKIDDRIARNQLWRKITTFLWFLRR